MTKKRKKRGIPATSYGIELLQEAKANGGGNCGKSLTYDNIAEKAELDRKTVVRFFKGWGVDSSSARKICNVLGLKLADVTVPNSSQVIEDLVEGSEKSKESFVDAIKEKEDEIERLRRQGSTYESELTRLEAEKVELEKCVKRFDDFIGQLKGIATEFEGRMSYSRQAAKWLNARHQKALAKEAAEYVLRKYAELEEPSGGTNSHHQLKQFTKDIRKYLYLIHHCLDSGSKNLLLKAHMESKIPFTLQPNMYLKAFEFIKDQRVPENMPSEVVRELRLYLDSLIGLIKPLL